MYLEALNHLKDHEAICQQCPDCMTKCNDCRTLITFGELENHQCDQNHSSNSSHDSLLHAFAPNNRVEFDPMQADFDINRLEQQRQVHVRRNFCFGQGTNLDNLKTKGFQNIQQETTVLFWVLCDFILNTFIVFFSSFKVK